MRNRTNIEIPSDWEILTVDQISKSPLRNGLYKDNSAYGTGIPMVHMGDVFANKLISSGDGMQRVELTEKEVDSFTTKSGDILFARRSLKPEGAGDTSLLLTDLALSYESSVIRVRPSKVKVDPRYVSEYLSSSFGKAQMMTLVRVVAVSGITGSDLKNYQLPIPPLPEQKKIAEILSTWDEAIELAGKQLENAKTQKRALMQQLLTGKRRFPEFENQEFREAKLGDISSSWSGGTPSRSKPEYYNGSIPWIKSGEVNAARVTETSEHITEDALANSSASLVNPDTILVAMYGATAGVVSISGITAAINQAILAVVPNPNISSPFLYHAVKAAMNRTKRLTQGGQPNLNASIIRSTKLWLPSLNEQQKIASAISSAQIELTSLRQKIDHLRTEKKALMQQLLTGKKRVKV